MQEAFLRTFLLIVLSFFFCLAPQPANAADKVTFALFTRGWPPLEMTRDGQGVGAAVDIFREVMPEGMVTKVEPLQKPRAYLRENHGGIFTRLEAKSWIAHPDRFWWSDPVIEMTNVLYSPSGVPLEFKDLSSLEGKRIGCIKNYSYPDIEPLFAAGKAVRHDVNQDYLLLRLVKSGRVDAVIMDAVTARWIIRNSDEFNKANFYVAKKPLAKKDLRFIFNKVEGWDRHLPEINRQIRQLRESGGLQRILSNYE